MSVPEVVGLFGDAGEVGLVLVSSAGGVSEGVVRVWCIEPEPLRPCAVECFLLFLLFALEVDLSVFAELSFAFTLDELSVPVPVAVDAAPWLGTALDELSRLELSAGWVWELFAPTSAAGVAFAFGSLLGSVLLVEAVLDELPGRALLF